MKAVLLAAGLGTRLRPLTDTIPKCLVPIDGKPLLDIWCESLLQNGITKILVNLHYKAEIVESHIRKAPFAAQIKTVFEPNLLGTAGTLVANKRFFEDDDGMLVHADNYSLFDISKLIGAHSNRPSQCLMTMLAFRTSTPATCGILSVDNSGVLQDMYEKSSEDHGNLANGALYILSSELIRSLSSENDFSTEVIPNLYGRTYVVETNETHFDIGSPENYELAQKIAKDQKTCSPWFENGE